jgi:hypothetical protein
MNIVEYRVIFGGNLVYQVRHFSAIGKLIFSAAAILAKNIATHIQASNHLKKDNV